MKKSLLTIAIAFVAGLAGAWCFSLIGPAKPEVALQQFTSRPASPSYPELASPQTEPEADRPRPGSSALPQDFTLASRNSTASVVYIRTLSTRSRRRSWIDLFFDGNWQSQQVGSGSGVIYTQDGYIITNNHVIEGADDIEVIHGKNKYIASLIGTDPNTDLAILKIEEEQLPAITLGSSSTTQVGDWVLAVGNPFNLTSTVTAGIVSAKGRQINILQGRFPIESFIQTDAAINPGNSGGALVNIEGELVGINTAILSQTGSYAGYGFAVPVDIARKIADDIIQYGEVQKALLGVEVIDLTQEVAERLGMATDQLDGILIERVYTKTAADRAGLNPGDVIVSLNDIPTNNSGVYDELLSFRSPGDTLRITLRRKGDELVKEVVLTNRAGTTDLLLKEVYDATSLGVQFETIPDAEKASLNLKSGVRVGKIKNGFFKKLGIPEGFIITSVNSRPMNDPEELTDIIEKIRGKVIIRGINNQGLGGYYTFYF